MAKKHSREAKITSVTFRSNVDIKPFHHIHIEATAQVLPGQTASGMLDQLKYFVANELRIAKEGESVERPGRFRV